MSVRRFICLVAVAASSASAYAKSPLDGIWKSDGYGEVLTIAGTKVEHYQVSAAGAVKVGDGELRNMMLSLTSTSLRYRLQRTKAGMTMRGQDIARGRSFQRILAMPNVIPSSSDPVTNFEVFWTTFKEHYPFFQLRGMDWDARYARFRPTVTARTTSEELFEIFKNMVADLDDGHVWINDGKTRASIFKRHALAKQRPEILRLIKEKYLRGQARELANGKIFYGELSPRLAYIQVFQLAQFLPTGNYIENLDEQWKVLNGALEESFRFAAPYDVLVLDLRINGGGVDDFARAVAGRVCAKRVPAYAKRAKRVSGGYTPTQHYFTEPAKGTRFLKKVLLLTSEMTASGAEVLVMSTMRCENVQRIGEPTGGFLSDVLDRKLPNGWSFGLSNEDYIAPDGHVYEHVGVPPHVELKFSKEAFEAGTDNVLDEVLKNYREVSDALRTPRIRYPITPCQDGSAW